MQHRLLITAAFFALATCACSRTRTKGFPIYIADAPTVRLDCGDAREIFVSALGNHRFAINDSGALDAPNLISGLQEILQYRAEKVLFLRAEPGASYADFVEVTDAVYHADIRVAVMTHQVQALERKGGCLMLSGYLRNRKPTHESGSSTPDPRR